MNHIILMKLGKCFYNLLKYLLHGVFDLFGHQLIEVKVHPFHHYQWLIMLRKSLNRIYEMFAFEYTKQIVLPHKTCW